MQVNALMNAIVANRKQLFDLVGALESQTSSEIDVGRLEEIVDCNYDGRESVTHDEAQNILMYASRCKSTA